MAWLTGWKFRKKHEINGSSAGSVTDYQVKIVCHYGSGTDSGGDVYLNSNCRTDFGDVRFTDSDGSTLLDYWMEEKVDSDYAVFWVKVSNIPASPDTVAIYIYYGKNDATYSGDASATFEFFDDFDVFDTDKWVVEQGEVSVSNSELVLEGTTGTRGIIHSASSFAPGHAMHARVRWGGSRVWNSHFCRMHDPNDRSTVAGSIFGSSADNKVDFVTSVSGTETKTSGITVSSPTSYHVYKVTWVSGKSRAYQDDTLLAEHTSNIPTVNCSAAFVEGTVSGENAYVDWVFIRKYVDPEPSHGAWYAAECITEFSESVATSDVIVKSVSITRTESLSLSDVVSVLRVKIKELVESIGLSDVVVKFASIVRSETIAMSDVLEKVKTMYREFVETIGLSDRISKLISIVKSEPLSLTDILEKRFVILKILTETLGLSDTLARIRIKKTLARIKGVTRILSAIREKPAERELGR